jgi:hypothetical protein
MPTYLQCPFCPAQSYIKSERDSLVLYECPAKHRFYIERELNVRDDGDSRVDESKNL